LWSKNILVKNKVAPFNIRKSPPPSNSRGKPLQRQNSYKKKLLGNAEKEKVVEIIIHKITLDFLLSSKTFLSS